ncbi:MAG: aminotransferase class V-fold PLP-dependent enzyme [Acidimicrobiia bacterium]|nr:aminotransferase class V-fold PLP-dependent enzyme [Acidimicrobiia bacterium]
MTAEFSLPAERVWCNAAHQGPLPDRAAEAVAEVVRWKQEPHHLASSEPFHRVPSRLRSALGALIDAPAEEIALANSSSYGIHLVADGLGLVAGDQVIVASNDFPSTILPWLRLRNAGVEVVGVQPMRSVLSPDEIAAAITPRTRVVCLTWVHSFSGQVIDLDAIGELCRSAGVLFVVNGSQGVGAIPLRVHEHPVDVLTSVGFKWLCGPYGTGFCWLHADALDRVGESKLYWLGTMTAEDLARPDIDLEAVEQPAGAARHDVFGTANFFNFAPWATSVELVLGTGVERIHSHNLGLAALLENGIDSGRFEVQDRGDPRRRSSILLLRPVETDSDEVMRRLVERGIDVAHRRGLIRLSPHFYNTSDDIDRAVIALADC